MPRKITSGRVGRSILGSIVSDENTLQSVVANSNLTLEPNGTGFVVTTNDLVVNGATDSVSGAIRLNDNDGLGAIALKAPGTVSGTKVFTMPDDYPTVNGRVLSSTVSGTLSWSAISVSVADQIASTSTFYPSLITTTSGSADTLNTSSSKLSFVPSSGTLTASNFSGNLTGNVTSSNVDINGGSIDGTTIGANSEAAGTFSSITETSSIEYKQNINPITNALDTILSLNGVTYDRKDLSEINEAGLIAEEVEKILPNLVKHKGGRPDSLHYTKLSAYLIEAVKILKKEIDELKGIK